MITKEHTQFSQHCIFIFYYSMIEIISETFDDYNESNVIINKNIDKIKNVVLFDALKSEIRTEKDFGNMPFFYNKIIINPKYYIRIKNILLNNLEMNDVVRTKLIEDLNILEIAGFNAFVPYKDFNDKVKQLLRGKIAYMLTTVFN